jgi:hypothetical protein
MLTYSITTQYVVLHEEYVMFLLSCCYRTKVPLAPVRSLGTYYQVVCVCDYETGYGLDIGLSDHLYTTLGTTRNYCAIANLRILQCTTAPAKPFPACCAATNRFLATLLTVEVLELPALRSSCHSRPCRTLVNSLNWQLPTPELNSQLSSAI